MLLLVIEDGMLKKMSHKMLEQLCLIFQQNQMTEVLILIHPKKILSLVISTKDLQLEPEEIILKSLS